MLGVLSLTFFDEVGGVDGTFLLGCFTFTCFMRLSDRLNLRGQC